LGKNLCKTLMKQLFTFLFGLVFIFTAQAQNLEEPCLKHNHLARLQNERLNFSQDLYNKMLLYDVKQYHLNLNVETNTTFISGNVRFFAQANADITTFAFELHPNYTISSVVVKNITHTGTAISRTNNEIRVNLISAINEGEFFEAIIYYSGNGPVDNSNPDAGFCQRTASNGKKYTYTMSQPYGTADWMPVKQILADKADSVKVYITTSATNRVGSQGLLKQVVNVGGGKLRYEWESKYPIAYYLISFAVGEYADYVVNANFNAKTIPIINYLYDSASITANQTNLNQTKATLEKFSELFGEYPFADEKYGHCQVPHNFYLENQTMSSMMGFPNTVIAHELAHQWFGDALTLFSFSEIGLTEGFATYSEYLYREHFVSLSSAQNTYNNWRNNVMSQPGGSVYLTDSLNTTAMFDSRLIYQKGACLIHMIRYLVNNDALFWQAVSTFTNTYKHQNVNYNLFAGVVQSVTGVNLTQDFLPQWFRGEGYPTYKITWNWKDGYFHLISEQSTSKPSVTPFFKMPFELAITDINGNTTIVRFAQNANFQKHKIPFATQVASISFDPRIFLVAKSTLSYDNTLIVEDTPPQIIELRPAHLANQVAVDSPLEITFDENIFAGSGKIWIKNAENNAIFHEFEMGGAGVNISGRKLRFKTPQNFEPAQSYFVEMENGAIRDRMMNFFTGFSGQNTWKFTTFDPINHLQPNQEFLLYPNPVENTLNVRSGVPVEKILLYNQLGQAILEATQTNSIWVGDLPKGIYVVKVILANGETNIQKVSK
jgi:hypothetical protein